MQGATYRRLTIAAVALIVVAWGAYAGYHARHWLGYDDGHEPDPDGDGTGAGIVTSSHITTLPFEAVLGPVVRDATSGATVGQVVEFDIDVPDQAARAMVLLEWTPNATGAQELVLRVSWRTGGIWGEPTEVEGVEVLLLEVPRDVGAEAVRVTVLPASTGVVVEQPVAGWVAFHAAR